MSVARRADPQEPRQVTARRNAVVALLLLLALLGRAPDLFHHFRDWDEAAMMSQAWAMTRGEVLYRDVFQFHPPLNMVYFVPFFALLEPDVVPHAVKATNLLLVALAGVLIFELALARLRDGATALAMAAVFVFSMSGRFSWALSAHGEFLAQVPILLSALLLFTGDRRPRRAFLAGCLWSVAFFLKQVALVDCLVLLVVLGIVSRRERVSMSRLAARLAFGFAAVTTVVFCWFVVDGSVGAATERIFVTSLRHYGATNGERFTSAALRFLATELPWLCGALPFAFTAAIVRRREQPSAPWFLLASGSWLAVVLVAVSSAKWFYGHYLLQALPPLAATAGAALLLVPRRARRSACAVLIVLLAVSMARSSAGEVRELAANGWQPPAVRASRAVATIVRSRTDESDRIFLYRTLNLDVFYLAERLSNNGIYMFADMFAEHMNDPALAADQRRRFLARLPKLIVASDTQLRGFPSSEQLLAGLLERCYEPVAEVEHMRVFERSPDDDSTTSCSQ